MTREDIIRMAREAGLSITPARSGEYHGGMVGCDAISLARFAALVAAAEHSAQHVGWVDEFGNVYPVAAWKPIAATHHDSYKAKWECVYRFKGQHGISHVPGGDKA